jgi:hypothetical protein
VASWTDNEPPCPVCRRNDHDRAGNVKHEAWCPHFLRGPDPGGDPYEWPSLLDAVITPNPPPMPPPILTRKET